VIRPHLVRQETRLMPPLGTPNVHELRNYRTKPGAVLNSTLTTYEGLDRFDAASIRFLTLRC
jgi:hypothetical protein